MSTPKQRRVLVGLMMIFADSGIAGSSSKYFRARRASLLVFQQKCIRPLFAKLYGRFSPLRLSILQFVFSVRKQTAFSRNLAFKAKASTSM